ncbi:undecaprenyl-diphosphate phosphatase [Dellaglioa sp. BT-FLS60]
MNIIEMIKVIVLGVVEGITEWLPISSTGHMILVDEFLKLKESAAFMDMFLVVIQLGAIMAVVVLYFHKLNPFSPRKSQLEKRDTWSLWSKVIVAVLPAAVIGLVADDWMTAHLYNFPVVALMLIIYGVLFIVIENKKANTTPSITTFNQVSYRTAAWIGVFQVLALVPGTSRSGATILGAILLGTSRFIAAEFSFFLSIPVMFGASLLKIFKYFHSGHSFTGDQTFALVLGCVVAFVVSIVAIKFLMGYIKSKDFKPFGWYRIILGALLLIYYFFIK